MRELVIDSFAGGGGASSGITWAIGRSPDIAINHDPVALGVHAANHPETMHLVSNIWKAEPVHVCAGRPVGMLWASPDCRHFSKAKGGKPVDKSIRGLPYVVWRWAKEVRPRVIFLENVEEFADWGPLLEDNTPCPDRKGKSFKKFKAQLRNLGYRVQHRELRACDYGAPTIRKRLFMIARCDGLPIVWPKPTHGKPDSEDVMKGKLLPWRVAADCIDWNRVCPSIFATSKQIFKQYGIRAIRPLADATMARIARGVERYVINAVKPFLIPVVHTGDTRTYPIDEPHRTVTCAHRGEQALVTPFVARTDMHLSNAGCVYPPEEPLRTVTSANGHAVVAPFVTKFNRGATGHAVDEPLHTITSAHSDTHPGGATPLGVVTPFLAPRYQEKPGQEPRTRSVAVPAATIVSGGNVPGMLVAPLLTRQFGASIGSDVNDPAPTVMPNGGVNTRNGERPGQEPRARDVQEPYWTPTAQGSQGAVAAVYLQTTRSADKPFNGADEPTHTVTAGGARIGVVSAFLAQHNGGMVGHGADEPISTIVQKGCTQAVVSAGLISMKGSDRRSASIEEPTVTQTAGGWHQAEVRAFLVKYFGTNQDPRLEEPMHTATTKPRFGLVTVNGEPHEIVDIGMRMLTPRELFRAQGFPDSYVIDRTAAGDPVSKTDQIRLCGNSVCPQVAEALVRANYAERVVSNDRSAPAFQLEAAE